MVASWLMSPDWTSGDMFGIRPILHTLWVLIANVTYFVYAILLIFIALATIFNSDKYGYKQLLPKLALGILLVPLTWWFIQFIISLSSIVTASVMNIPMEALQANTQTNPTLITSPSIRKKYIYENDITKKEVGEKKPCETNDSDANPCISPQKMLESAGGIYSPLLIYAYSIFKVGDIKNVDGIVDGLKSGTQVVHQVIFGAIMFTVF